MITIPTYLFIILCIFLLGSGAGLMALFVEWRLKVQTLKETRLFNKDMKNLNLPEILKEQAFVRVK